MISNIEEIKAAADIVEIIGEFVKLKKEGANLRGLCPFHSEKSPSFTVSKAKDIYKCFGCGASGDSINFLMEHENYNYVQAIEWLANKYNIPIEQTSKTYEKPPERLETVSPELIKYFEGRGISNDTVIRMKIGETTEWMPKTKDQQRVVCFNYYRNDELINIKYRSKGKDFKMHTNAELIFYNLDALENETTAIIVEGEVDCMSMQEAGIYNSVSVPNGAQNGGSLKYLDNCWQHFDGKDKIIIFTDNDPAGLKLRDELARRLGKDRCFKVDFPADCKDANDILVKHGKQMIHSVIEQAKPWPIDGILTMDNLYETIDNYYKNGYPKGCIAGVGEFDEYLQFSSGQLTTVTGAPGSGKSEFIDYISTSLSRNHNWKFGVCSFENPAAIHATKLMEKFTGLSFNFRKDPNHRMTQRDFEMGIGFLDQYYYFINILQADLTIQGLLSKARELVVRFGIKGLIIDPWNYIEHKVPDGYTETQYISEALTLIKEFAAKNDVHVFLVAHPRKLMKDQKTKEYPIATMYDIAGSAHFFNKTDNGVSVHRDFKTGLVTVYVQKVRFSWLGKLGFATYNYDTFIRQYTQI